MHEIKVGEHWLEHIGPFQVHMDTLLTAWLAMGAIILFAFVVTRKLNIIPDGLQSLSETLMGFLEGIVQDLMGNKGKKHLPVIASLFLFILIANLEGQLPWRLIPFEEGELASPTNDINTTLALALIVVIYYFGAGINEKGIGYFKHYFKPLWFMFPFNLLEDFTRPLSLSLRLFANIVTGELIILILLSIAPVYLFFMPIPIMLYELFVAFLQAYVFTTLAATYIGSALSEEH
ncbi:MAG: ATP synthase F0 subunit A [Candidatus Melainabacteria bacterium GWF2_37_15]|nr:MAG: ATP synthase F0 subunit A [Candidatus Melainabacteria bacterium GWF2_37_15]